MALAILSLTDGGGLLDDDKTANEDCLSLFTVDAAAAFGLLDLGSVVFTVRAVLEVAMEVEDLLFVSETDAAALSFQDFRAGSSPPPSLQLSESESLLESVGSWIHVRGTLSTTLSSVNCTFAYIIGRWMR